MSEPIWVTRSSVNAIHNLMLAEHGGMSGIRDEGLLESALARPVNAYAYGETDLCTLATSYAFGICRNHPFVDGNKRTAFLTACIFLDDNGLEFIGDEVNVVKTILALAAGQISEEEFATWLRAHTKK